MNDSDPVVLMEDAEFIALMKKLDVNTNQQRYVYAQLMAFTLARAKVEQSIKPSCRHTVRYMVGTQMVCRSCGFVQPYEGPTLNKDVDTSKNPFDLMMKRHNDYRDKNVNALLQECAQLLGEAKQLRGVCEEFHKAALTKDSDIESLQAELAQYKSLAAANDKQTQDACDRRDAVIAHNQDLQQDIEQTRNHMGELLKAEVAKQEGLIKERDEVRALLAKFEACAAVRTYGGFDIMQWRQRALDAEKISFDAQHLLDCLQRFKKYVHKRLDDAGIEADPEPEKNKEHGCRVEGRLNKVLNNRIGDYKHLLALNNTNASLRCVLRKLLKEVRDFGVDQTLMAEAEKLAGA